ncbi:unnamed protein product [Miscanthus lutarioriparius]|uniref:RING-type E3 ubiquitin transferase n=1 Tax=Miscanthus lutarioriparius TaxID=422564 RepID=A0A811MES5_9POAL|nr:unnamed protein product [Miscanthus lutarioriparius]
MRAQPEQENKNTTRPQRGTAGVSHSQGRERHSFTKSLASAARPPRLLLTSPPARQTPAVGAAARTGQDQGGGACPFRPPDPLRRGPYNSKTPMMATTAYIDDSCSEVIDPPKTEVLDVAELPGDHTQHPPKPNVVVSSSVRELLECPVCLSAMYPPIHQCSNGHTLCSGCKPRVHNRCPTCRHELGNIRCLALEKVAASLEVPCKYQSFGCSGIYPYYSKLKHESQCQYRPYSCPYAGSECTVAGDIPYLVNHLKDDHKVDMHNGCTFNHRYVKPNPHEVENATWMLTVFSCFGQYFCLHFEAFQLGMSRVYITFLRFMGDDTEAKNYSYSLEVGGTGRKMIWQGVPRSIRDSHRKVRDSYDGLIIQRNMALFFSGGDRKELKLRVTGRIWKEQ